VTDPRSLAFIVFQKLRQEATSAPDEELTESGAMRIFLDAINLMPDYEATTGARENVLLIQREGVEFQLNIQDAMDSLIVVWNDYQDIMRGRSA
jgi:hypothetical protein